MIQTENRDETYVQLVAEAEKSKATGLLSIYAITDSPDNPEKDMVHESVFDLNDYQSVMLAIDTMMARPNFKLFTFTDSGKKYMREVHGETY